MVNIWIVPTHIDHWELVKKNNLYAFHRELSRNKISVGDKLVFYIVKSRPSVFVGIFEVSGSSQLADKPFWPDEIQTGRVIHIWRFPLTPIRQGGVDVKSLVDRLKFVENKDRWMVYFLGSLANFNRPISEEDYMLIFNELGNPPVSFEAKPRALPVEEKARIRPTEISTTIDFNYIPPVVLDLPRLARNDPSIPDASKRFEEKLWILGRMLGYTVEELGHKRSAERLPDAAFVSIRDHYAIILDAKAREDGYELGTYDRTIVEYVKEEFDRLQKERGVSRVHYVIVSSGFNGDPTRATVEIRRKVPACQSVSFVTPETLLYVLELHLMAPSFTAAEIEDIFMQGGIIGLDDVTRPE